MFITHHIIKSELWTDPPVTREQLAAITDDAVAVNGTSPILAETYDEWPRYDRPPSTYASPSGRVLLTHGELDFTSPPFYQPTVDHYLTTRDDNVFILVDRAPHGLGSPTPAGFNCAPSMMWSFARDLELPQSCVADILPLAFEPAAASSLSFLGTADAWDGDVAVNATSVPSSPAFERVRAAYLRVRPDAVVALRRGE